MNNVQSYVILLVNMNVQQKFGVCMTKMKILNDEINDQVRLIRWDDYITTNILMRHT